MFKISHDKSFNPFPPISDFCVNNALLQTTPNFYQTLLEFVNTEQWKQWLQACIMLKGDILNIYCRLKNWMLTWEHSKIILCWYWENLMFWLTNSLLRLSLGSAATQVRWGGHCIYAFVSWSFVDHCTKFYSKWSIFEKVIAKNTVPCFFEPQCISLSADLGSNTKRQYDGNYWHISSGQFLVSPLQATIILVSIFQFTPKGKKW
jgi:hypothetical protein